MTVTQVVVGTKTSGKPAWLEPGAAASWNRMLTGGMPGTGITDAGRTNAEQWDLWRRYQAGELLATAAYPGSATSYHESGLCVDATGATQTWLIAHGAEHGWWRPLLHAAKPEPWHWQYDLTRDRHLTPTIPPAPLEDDDMFSDTDRKLLQNVENLLARDSASGGGIRGDVLTVIDAIAATKADVGTVANELRALAARPAGEGGPVDLAPILAAIQALPAATVAAIKAAL